MRFADCYLNISPGLVMIVPFGETENMNDIRKFIVSVISGLLLFIGIIMVLLPGPALILIPLALLILKTQHPEKAKVYVRKFQRFLSKSAHWLDNIIKKWS